MPGNHPAAEPSWRPLTQKLSGFIRHSSTRSKKSSVTTDEKSSVSRFRRQKKRPSPESVPELKPLEVDLNVLESFRLSECWLETDTQDADHGCNEQPPSAPAKSTTPIKDLFSSKSVLDFSISGQSGQLDRSSSQKHDNNDRRARSTVETQSITYSRTSADVTSTRNTQAAGSILDRGRPIEPKRFVTDAWLKTTSSRHEIAPQVSKLASEKAATSRDLSLKASQYSSHHGSSLVTEQNVFSQGQLDPNHRHSMYAVVTPSENRVSATAGTAPTLRNASAAPSDRMHVWQKSITSAPTSAAAAGLPSSPGSALTSAAMPPANIPVRRISTRGVGNRLAWIRELEEKKLSRTNGDIGVLRKQAGSVSDKLAMFESKKMPSASPIVRLNPVARSNSSTSRLSWAGLESTSSANSNITATPRTSIDTVRSSHRASSVMSYYDDSFREKLESVVGGQTADKNNSDLEGKQRVATQLVLVKSEKVEDKPQSSLPDTGASITFTRAEASEEVPQSVHGRTGTSTTESDKTDEESNVRLSTAGLVGSEEETSSVQQDAVATIIEAEKTRNPRDFQLEASSSTTGSGKQEKVDKVETEPLSSSAEATAFTLDLEKEEEAEEEAEEESEAGSSRPELKEAEEEPQSS